MDDMQALARDDDAADLRTYEIALHDFIRDLVAESGAPLGCTLTVLLPAPHALVRADPGWLREALLNLLRTAADRGAVELRVLRERDAWRFELADEAAELLRDEDVRLQRAEPTLEEREAGLAVVQGIAAARGGSAGFENGPGAGATLWLRVPQTLLEASQVSGTA